MSERALREQTVAPATRAGWDWPRIVGLVLAAAGLLVALYLAYAELLIDTSTMACPSEGGTIFGLPIDCGTVNTSRYATVGPIPVALLGVAGYLGILLVLLLEHRLGLLVAHGRLIIFGLTLFGFAFSLYLTWAEVTQIKAFCSWCMASAAVMTALFVVALVRLGQQLRGLDGDESAS
ncbi:MAG: hypothetical protein Kow00120_18340 [Anaerolineae bacterium]